MLNYIKTGSGTQYIIFIHGNSQSAECWYEVTNQPLLANYTTIALDLPGHGDSFRSSKPEQDYSLLGLAHYTLEFLRQFEHTPYILVGNSLASNIIGEIALQLKNCKGIVITASCAAGKGINIENILQPNPNLGAMFLEKPNEYQLNALIEDTVSNTTTENKNLIKQLFINTDLNFRVNFANSIAAVTYTDELQNIEDSGIATAYVFGKEEKLCAIHYLDSIDLPKWKNKVLLIENSGHFSNIDQPKKLAEIISEFTEDCFKLL